MINEIRTDIVILVLAKAGPSTLFSSNFTSAYIDDDFFYCKTDIDAFSENHYGKH